MFSKAYKLKSINTLKNSEKKHLSQHIQKEFPSATEEVVKELVPVKSCCTCLKLILHSGETVGVYTVDGVPLIIEQSDRLVPTLCALWKIPDLVPTLIIHSLVLPKIQCGVPLYLPGVVIPTAGAGFPMFPRDAVICATTDDNAAAAVVGRAVLSSGDMLLRTGGVCLDTIHYFGDLLCKEAKFAKITRPQLGPPMYGHREYRDMAEHLANNVAQLNIQQKTKDEWPSLGKQPIKEEWPSLSERQLPSNSPVPNEPKIIPDSPEHVKLEPKIENDVILDNTNSEKDGIPTDMDGLLRWCLLSFIKLEGKCVELPLKTNLLYKNYLITLCPPDRTLDVKKSTYKKMGKFLEAMQEEGLIEVREIDKGVDAIVAVQTSHPLVRSHVALSHHVRAEESETPAGEYVPPQIREVFCVTANVAELFTPIKKGTPLSAAEVRSILTNYVKTRNLQSTQHKGAVILDLVLAKIVGKQEQEHIKWDVLMNAVQGKMTPGTEMRFADGTFKLNKTKLELIKMQVASRSGNKKVTLVSNLQLFGFSLPELSRVCQHGVAASCGVTRSPGAKADQLMLQGDQTYFITKLLIEKYRIPKKYVEGADKALKKKKC